ncbi:uncharacterized protein TM35_000132440, partial [Trypanosoma theileri]
QQQQPVDTVHTESESSEEEEKEEAPSTPEVTGRQQPVGTMHVLSESSEEEKEEDEGEEEVEEEEKEDREDVPSTGVATGQKEAVHIMDPTVGAVDIMDYVCNGDVNNRNEVEVNVGVERGMELDVARHLGRVGVSSRGCDDNDDGTLDNVGQKEDPVFDRQNSHDFDCVRFSDASCGSVLPAKCGGNIDRTNESTHVVFASSKNLSEEGLVGEQSSKNSGFVESDFEF